jgi:hypothetical protein
MKNTLPYGRAPPSPSLWLTCFVVSSIQKENLMAQEPTIKDLLEKAAELFELVRRDPTELAEQLVTNSMAVEVLQDGLSAYIKQKQSEIPTEAHLFEPKVTATFSEGQEDELPLTNVDVTVWFVLASDEDLRDLREEAYGGDETSERLARFMTLSDKDVINLFLNAEQVVCQVNQQEAEAWIARHRPHLRENEA